MTTHLPAENSLRVVVLALALWGGGVTLGAWEGVFEKLAPAEFAALAIFSAAFAAASYVLDRALHAAAARLGTRSLRVGAIVADVIVAVSALALFGAEGHGLDGAARFPMAIVALFGAPLAGVLTIAAAGRRVRSAPATSPGATPAAT